MFYSLESSSGHHKMCPPQNHVTMIWLLDSLFTLRASGQMPHYLVIAICNLLCKWLKVNGKASRELASFCCLPRGLPLVTGGWVNFFGRVEKWNSDSEDPSSFLHPCIIIPFCSQRRADILLVYMCRNSVSAPCKRSPAMQMEGKYYPSAGNSFSQILDKKELKSKQDFQPLSREASW